MYVYNIPAIDVHQLEKSGSCRSGEHLKTTLCVLHATHTQHIHHYVKSIHQEVSKQRPLYGQVRVCDTTSVVIM